jgi:hypothetical protein
MSQKNQSEGRKRNAAQPLGERKGIVSNKGAARTGEAEKRSAGPDGPDADRAAKTVKPGR